MELDRATAVLRPRDAWEGQDLGFALARTWFLPLWLLWWTTALPLSILCLFLTGLRPDLWLLALWWLKPIYEGPLLIWASRALFGERLGRKDLRDLLRQGLPSRLLPYLLWRRIGMRRSYLMPLTLLEGLKGPAARRRRQVVINGAGAPVWVTLSCYHFEILIWASLLLGVFFMVPEELPRLDLLAAVTDDASWAYWVSVAGYLLAFSVIAPFYVCAGFALYLSRRTELEAWDLELAFRRAQIAAASTTRQSARRAASGLLVVPLLLGVLLLPSAASEAGPPTSPESAHALIEEVLASPDFGRMEEVHIWVPITKPEAEEGTLTLPDWLRSILLILAGSLKWVLLALATLAVALLVLKVLRDWRGSSWALRRGRPGLPTPRRTHESLEIAGLPADPVAAVRVKLRGGDRRGALSLLYRASLEHLTRLGLEIPEGATEGDCLTLAVRALPAASLGPFGQVTRAWQGLAYAHRLPTDAAIGALIDAWSQWTAETAGAPS